VAEIGVEIGVRVLKYCPGEPPTMCAKKAVPANAGKSVMSGNKSAAGSANGTTVPLAAKTVAAKGSGGKSAAAKSAAKERTLSNHDIGEVAGEIWELLSTREATLAAIKKAVPAPAEVVVAAIGWLAREDKLAFATSRRVLKVSLKK
jgi:hypothetical protein